MRTSVYRTQFHLKMIQSLKSLWLLLYFSYHFLPKNEDHEIFIDEIPWQSNRVGGYKENGQISTTRQLVSCVSREHFGVSASNFPAFLVEIKPVTASHLLCSAPLPYPLYLLLCLLLIHTNSIHPLIKGMLLLTLGKYFSELGGV